jgi:hypothetical protein
MRNFQRRNAEKKANMVAARAHGLSTHNEQQAEDDPRQLYVLATLVRNAFVVGLCVCIAIPATALARALVPGTYATLLPFVCILIAIDLLLISPRLNKLGLFSKDWFLLNGSRWVIIIVLLKLLSYVGQDTNRMLDDLPLMRRDVLVYLFTPQFLASLGVVLVVWLACRTLGQDLASLTWGERELAHDPELGLRTDRTQIRQTLVAHIVGFGVLATLLGGAAQWAGRQTASGLWVAVDLLAYFVLGLALIGHSQLTILRTSWLWERTPIAKNLVTRWSVYGALFLMGLALLALVLPVGNVSGLLPLLNYAFGVLFYIVQLIAFLVVALLQLLMLPLLWLFGNSAPTPMALPPPPPPIAAEPTTPPLPMPAWYENAQNVLFFAIVVMVLGYALRYVLMQHEGLRAAIAKLPVVVWLRGVWGGMQRLWRSARNELATLRQHDADADANALAVLHPQKPEANWRTLPLRQQVAWLYAQAVQQAQANGLVRRPAQTPHEFANALSKAAPDADGDVHELTQQFEEARYSQHAVQPIQVSVAERCVRRIRQALRSTK